MFEPITCSGHLSSLMQYIQEVPRERRTDFVETLKGLGELSGKKLSGDALAQIASTLIHGAPSCFSHAHSETILPFDEILPAVRTLIGDKKIGDIGRVVTTCCEIQKKALKSK